MVNQYLYLIKEWIKSSEKHINFKLIDTLVSRQKTFTYPPTFMKTTNGCQQVFKLFYAISNGEWISLLFSFLPKDKSFRAISTQLVYSINQSFRQSTNQSANHPINQNWFFRQHRVKANRKVQSVNRESNQSVN